MRKAILAGTLLIVSAAFNAYAEAPNLFTYQGRLKEGGQAVSGSRTVEIKLCPVETGGVCETTGAQPVAVSNGLFRSTFTIPAAVNFGTGSWWLEIWVGGDQLTPRERLTSNAYSLFSATAAYAENISAAAGSDGVYISSNLYVTGGKYYGDGSQLQNLPVSGGAVAKTGDAMTGQLTLRGSTLTVSGNAFSVGGAAFRVENGRIGIGTVAPSGIMEINGTDNPQLLLTDLSGDVTFAMRYSNGAPRHILGVPYYNDRVVLTNKNAPFPSQPDSALILWDSGVTTLQMGTGGYLSFVAGTATEKARFTPQGNFGIGTTAPAYRLVVSSAAGEAGNMLVISTGTSDVIRLTGAGEIYANYYHGDGSQLSGVTATSVADGSLLRVSTFSSAYQVMLATAPGAQLTVGTDAPDAGVRLTVDGGIKIVSGVLIFPDNTSMNTAGMGSAGTISNVADADLLADSDGTGTGDIVLRKPTLQFMRITNSGKVGMGSSFTADGGGNPPAANLHVAGTGIFNGNVDVTGNFAANSGLGSTVQLSSTVVYGTLMVTGGISSPAGLPAYLASTQTFTGQNIFHNQVTVSSDIVTPNRIGIGVYDFDFAGSKYLQVGDSNVAFTNDNALAYLVGGANADAKLNFYRGATEAARLETQGGANLAMVLNGQTKTLTDATYHRIQNSIVWISTGYQGTPSIYVSSYIGNVGIGTAVLDPNWRLTVDGNLRISGGGNGLILPDGSVMTTAGGVADDAVTSAKIAAGAIVDSDINAGAAIDATKIGGGGVTTTEFDYLGGATGDIQTQLNAKASDIAVPHLTGDESIGGRKTFTSTVTVNNTTLISANNPLLLSNNAPYGSGLRHDQAGSETMIIAARNSATKIFLATGYDVSPSPGVSITLPANPEVTINNGKVGINATAPGYELDITGQLNATAGLCIGGTCKSSWAYIDNLGDHTATQALNMGDNQIKNVSSLTVSGSAFSVGGSTLVVKNGMTGINVAPEETVYYNTNNGNASLVVGGTVRQRPGAGAWVMSGAVIESTMATSAQTSAFMAALRVEPKMNASAGYANGMDGIVVDNWQQIGGNYAVSAAAINLSVPTLGADCRDGILIRGTSGSSSPGCDSGTQVKRGIVEAGADYNFFADKTAFWGGAATPLVPKNAVDINGAAAIGTYAGNNTAPANSLIVSGNVGIGVAAPSAALEVSGDARIAKHLTEAANSGMTVAAGDLGKTITVDAATTQTINLPSVGAGDIGAQITVVKLGAGSVIVQAAGGAAIADSGPNGSVRNDTAAETYAVIILRLVSATQWIITGGNGSWTTATQPS